MIYDVTITRLPLIARFDLQGEAAALADWAGAMLPPFPARPLSATEAQGRRLAWTGPGHWLLTAPLDDEAALAIALAPETAPARCATARVSDAYESFAITGPEAGEVMAVLTPLDLDPSAFGPDAVATTDALGAKALIRRVKGGFEVTLDRSWADWFATYLARICGEGA